MNNRKSKITLLTVMSGTLWVQSGCTSEMVFNALQQREQLQCQQHMASEYDRCVQHASGSYHSFQASRAQEVVHEAATP
ncbi:MAG: hypothetical protein U1F34_02380 [Gammaproteobacteria bacterium]